MTLEAGRRPPTPPFARRGAVAVVGAVGAVFALALGLQLWRWATVEREPPTGDAEWIWTEVPRYRSTPVAFWAAADFELSEPPAAAELVALGDEEYVLFLNGRRVGSNVYTPGAPLDVYQVGPLLRPGANRVAVELRSSRGDGGFLAALRAADGDGGPTLAATGTGTGAGWRVVAEQAEGVVGGALPAGVPALALGRPPTGKWGALARGPVRPLFTAATAGEGVPPRRLAPLGRHRPSPGWHPYRKPERPPRWLAAERPPGVVFDFGREVHGYLNLRFSHGSARPVGLLFTGDLPVDPLAAALAGVESGASEPGAAGAEGEADGGARRLEGLAAGAPVVTVPGRRNWTDVVPRRFRYAAVVGLPGLFGAWVEEVGEGAGAALPSPPEPVVAGVFGVTPPPLRSPVEDEVWRDLQGVADLPGRQRP